MRKQFLSLLATLCQAAPLALAQPVVSLFVAYRRPMRGGASPASRAALREVEVLMVRIAREAVGRK